MCFEKDLHGNKYFFLFLRYITYVKEIVKGIQRMSKVSMFRFLVLPRIFIFYFFFASNTSDSNLEKL